MVVVAGWKEDSPAAEHPSLMVSLMVGRMVGLMVGLVVGLATHATVQLHHVFAL